VQVSHGIRDASAAYSTTNIWFQNGRVSASLGALRCEVATLSRLKRTLNNGLHSGSKHFAAIEAACIRWGSVDINTIAIVLAIITHSRGKVATFLPAPEGLIAFSQNPKAAARPSALVRPLRPFAFPRLTSHLQPAHVDVAFRSSCSASFSR
jgi:hypothetical protein